MCDRFKKLPSEILREDWGDVMRVWSLLNTYESVNARISEQRVKKRR